MGSQHLNLKWRNHHSNLLTVFAQLLSSESFADVTLACDGASIRAHKIILSACSPFFHDIFAKHPCPNPIVILKDVSFKDLKVLIDFMYSGEVNIAQEYLPSFLRTAESLKIKGLSENESSTSCSSLLKRSANSESRSPLPSGCKRLKNSRNPTDVKTDEETLDTPETVTKESSSKDSSVSNHSPLTPHGTPVATDRYSSPMQRYEQAYNWGSSTDSSKYVEVNLQEYNANIADPSVSLNQDDSTTEHIGADTGSDSHQESKALVAYQGVPPDIESLRQLHRVTGLMSTVTAHYPGSPTSKNDNVLLGVRGELDIEATHPERDKEPPQNETGHVLTRLPRHKKKDCIVCGNRQAGQRRRSRQWCPGCNVGVHVHCFAQLEHYRRSNKRTPRLEEVSYSTATLEMMQIKNEEYNVTYAESNADSDIESSAQTETETITGEIG